MTLFLSCFNPESPVITHNGDDPPPYPTGTPRGTTGFGGVGPAASGAMGVGLCEFPDTTLTWRQGVKTARERGTLRGLCLPPSTPSTSQRRRGDQGMARAKVCTHLNLLPFCFVAFRSTLLGTSWTRQTVKRRYSLTECEPLISGKRSLCLTVNWPSLPHISENLLHPKPRRMSSLERHMTPHTRPWRLRGLDRGQGGRKWPSELLSSRALSQ